MHRDLTNSRRLEEHCVETISAIREAVKNREVITLGGCTY